MNISLCKLLLPFKNNTQWRTYFSMLFGKKCRDWYKPILIKQGIEFLFQTDVLNIQANLVWNMIQLIVDSHNSPVLGLVNKTNSTPWITLLHVIWQKRERILFIVQGDRNEKKMQTSNCTNRNNRFWYNFREDYSTQQRN